MGHEETVMGDEQMLAEIWDLGFGLEGAEGRPPTQKERFDRIRQVQAQITWEARDDEVKAAFEAGIKKMVEWIEKNFHYPRTKGGYFIPTDMLHDQLKEWGIE